MLSERPTLSSSSALVLSQRYYAENSVEGITYPYHVQLHTQRFVRGWSGSAF